jgi:hypothetical protein
MHKSFVVLLGTLLISAISFAQNNISVINTSVPNGTAYLSVPINLENANEVGAIQFSLKDMPNRLSVLGVSAFGRTAAEAFEDIGNGVPGSAGNGQYDAGEPWTDANNNGVWDSAFSVDFNDRDTTVSVLVYHSGGRVIPAGNEPILYITFTVPSNLVDDVIGLQFHELLNAEPQFLLVVSDPDGNAVPTNWFGGQATVGGILVTMEEGSGGSPGYSAELNISMENGLPVKGFQFNLVDAPNFLTLASVEAFGRASNFSIQANEVNGQIMVLGVEMSGGLIPSGSGVIAKVVVNISASAPINQPINVDVTNLIVAAQGGVPLPSYSEGSYVNVIVDVDDNLELPTEFALSQNYPNPFNPTTQISYDVASNGLIQLSIYNVLGQEIRTLVNDVQQQGRYTVLWNARDNNGAKIGSGVYLYRLVSENGFVDNKKMVILK